jgi:hypothetical protein
MADRGFSSLSIGEADQGKGTGDVEQRAPIGTAALLARQITAITPGNGLVPRPRRRFQCVRRNGRRRFASHASKTRTVDDKLMQSAE